MNRTARDNRPRVKPVQNVEVSEKHVTLRFVLFAVFLLVALVAFSFSLMSCLKTDSGWKTIEATATSNLSCADDFVFSYKLSGGVSTAAEYKQVIAEYTAAAEKAFSLFTNDVDYPDVHNIRYINQHVNEEVFIDEALYHAFSVIEKTENRNLYFAPVYEVYDNCFYCNDDSELVSYDPYSGEEVKDFFAQTAVYANDPEMIRLELLGDNRIKLCVSEEYLAFAEENSVTSFIDLNWMKNAFIIDFLADTLKTSGFTKGSLSSYDGFVRTLDNSGNIYNFALYNRAGNTVSYVSELSYSGTLSMVSLRDYKMNVRDDRYYEKQNGEMLTPYVDTADGMCRQAKSNMIFYSQQGGCAEILMQTIPVYVAESFDKEKLSELKENGVCSIYFDERRIINNGDIMKYGEIAAGYTEAPVSATDE